MGYILLHGLSSSHNRSGNESLRSSSKNFECPYGKFAIILYGSPLGYICNSAGCIPACNPCQYNKLGAKFEEEK